MAPNSTISEDEIRTRLQVLGLKMIILHENIPNHPDQKWTAVDGGPALFCKPLHVLWRSDDPRANWAPNGWYRSPQELYECIRAGIELITRQSPRG